MLRRPLKIVGVFVLVLLQLFMYWPEATLLSLPLGPGIVYAVSTETFTATTTWTAPSGVTSVTVEVWGGGGGGGGMNATSDGGGGGGGGAYSKKNSVAVTPGNGYTVTIGGAGTGGTGCSGQTAGGDSWFSSTGTVLAKGGSPGQCSTGTPPAGGAGGSATSGVGDTKYSGGQGEVGRNNSNGSGGYGGSSAGTASDGWGGPQTWSTVTYPTANTPAGGGHGGNAGGVGVAGSAPASGNGGGGGGAGEGTNIKGGNGASGKVILTYNKPVNAPTQDGPVNGATGVSVTPTFTMTATDADTTPDDISYKVTIYSDVGCSTVVQTNDQSVSSTGWTGTNASCTANPINCYASGTQGSFLTQTALSYGTQYWWKASAKDPDGNGTFVNSSSCNTFTTITPSVSILVTSDGSIAYGFVAAGGQKDTLTLTDTQTVKNDGNVPEDFTIKTSNATGGTQWSLGAAAGSDTFVHEFSVNGGGVWTKFTTADTYQSFVSNIASNGTQNFDLRITAPSSSTDFQQKSITVTILASLH